MKTYRALIIGSCASAFLAVHGPIKITFAFGVVSLMYFARIAIGDRL